MQRGLRVVSGPKGTGKVIVIPEGVCICGRQQGNTFFLEGEKVSKKHCSFHLDAEQFFIKDLNSSNGTFVNGKRITDSNLKTGDRIQIGEYLLEVVVKGSQK